MTAREHAKYFLAGAALGVYVLCPAYRYYVIGSWIALKIANEKAKYTVVPRSSRIYKRIMRAE
jgi:hypothetical protein